VQQSYQCPNCGAQVAFGVRFCTGCGTPLNWPTQQQMQPPPVHQQQSGHSTPWGGRTYQQMKRRGVGQWVRNHKFWSSVIILFVIGEVLSLFNLVNALGLGRTLGVYIFFGGLIWSIQARRRGLTMITLGSLLAPTAIILWVIAIAGGFVGVEGTAMGIAGFFTFLSVLFILWGIGRYRGTGTD